MSFYQLNLAVFAAGNAYLLYRQYRREQINRETQPLASGPNREDADGEGEDRDLVVENGGGAGTREAVRKFERDFFTVYALAVAADWLQVGLRNPIASSLAFPLLPPSLPHAKQTTTPPNIGPPHLRHLQVREGHSREDGRGAVRGRVHLRSDLGVVRGPAGGPARAAAGVPGVLRQLCGDVPDDAERQLGRVVRGPAGGRCVDDAAVQRVRGLDDHRVPPPRAGYLGPSAEHRVRVHDYSELHRRHYVGRRGGCASSDPGRPGLAVLGEHRV